MPISMWIIAVVSRKGPLQNVSSSLKLVLIQLSVKYFNGSKMLKRCVFLTNKNKI